MCRERCDGCPLKDRPIVPGHGKPGGIAIVGEAPGGVEARGGRPFIGASGRLLRETLKAAGIRPDDVFITNAVICHPPENATPSVSMVRACRSNLMRELYEARVTKIITLGGTSMKAVSGWETGITKVRGLGYLAQIPSQYGEVPEEYTEKVTIEEEVEYTTKKGNVKTKTIRRKVPFTLTRMVPDQPIAYRDVFAVSTFHPAAVLRQPDLFREMAEDIEKIANQDAPTPYPRIDVWIPRTVEECLEALRYISRASVVACDTETTGLDPLTDRIVSIGFGAIYKAHDDYDGVSVIIPKELVDNAEIKIACAAILDGRNFPGILVFHNLKYDAQMLKAYGAPVTHPQVTDTMMLAYALDERPGGRFMGRSLKTLARVRYDIPNYSFDFDDFNEAPLETRDWEAMYRYHAMDCYITARLYFDLRRDLEAESPRLLPLVQDIMVPACLAFADIELAGIQLDIPYLEDLKVRYEADLCRLREMMQRAWVQYGCFTEKTPEINPGSHVHLRRLLEAMGCYPGSTQRDPLLFERDTMDDTDPRRAILIAIIDYRLKSKVLSTYIVGLMSRADAQGRSHSSYKIDGTATGRTSSSDPNLQNIPVMMGPEIRAAFIASPGKLLMNADYSQLQLRIAAVISNDEKMKDVFRQGQDIHRIAAARVFRKPPEQVTKIDRIFAKRITFGVLFGRTGKAIVEGAEMAEYVKEGGHAWTRQEADAFIDEYLGEFPNLKAWIEAQHQFVVKHRYVDDLLGRRRRFPLAIDIGHMHRQSVNTPIQALEAEFVLRAIVEINKEIRARESLEGAQIVLTVHDSITLEFYPHQYEELRDVVIDCMENRLPIETDLKMAAEVEVGTRWSEMKEAGDANLDAIIGTPDDEYAYAA